MRYQKLGVFFGLFLISTILVSSQTLSLAYAVPGTGKLYGTTGAFLNEIFEIDPNTGLPIGPFLPIVGIFGSAGALTVNPLTGTMILGTGGGVAEVYSIDPTTGLTGFLCDYSFDFGAIHSLDYDASGDLFASVSFGGGSGATHLADLNLTGCTVDSVIPFSSPGIDGMAFDSNGTLLGGSIGGAGQLHSVNILTGVLTPIGAIDQGGQVPQGPGLGLTLAGGVASMQTSCTLGAPNILGGTGKANSGGIGHSDLLSIHPATGAGFDINGAASTIVLPVSLSALAFDTACPNTPVGGEVLSIDTTALLIAGAQANYSILSLLTIAGVGAFGALFYSVKRNSEKQ